MIESQIKEASKKFEDLLRREMGRVDLIKEQKDFVSYESLSPIIIGVCGGDGIGPFITGQCRRVAEYLLKGELQSGKVIFKDIDGLTIESRSKAQKAIPDDVLAELKECHIILKGPTTTPKAGDPWPNVESANVAMRKALDLFANVRPVRVLEEGIDWIFFRENTEGAYAVGSHGVELGDELACDFTITTKEGTERIARLAFETAKKTGKKRVSIVTKANIIKKTDGKFLKICYDMSKEYPDIKTDDWFIDIMTAKLIDKKRRTDFQVFILPNLYGDILTDEAAEFQGGVGTAGSANIGKRYAMFEAIHGSAPRMVEEGRGQFADPSSMLRALVMALSHMGFSAHSERLEQALDICSTEKKIKITGRDDGATGEAFCDYVMDVLSRV